MKYHTTLRVLALAIGLWAANGPALAQDKPTDPASAEQVREEYAYTIGVQAYLYGFAPVEMYRVRQQAVWDARNPNRTPLNRFRHFRDLLDPSSKVVVAPNNDTLYSSAWLDLSTEPVVLDVPDTAGRYYVMQLMDFYTNNFAYVGKRSTGTGAGSFAITGPGWSGRLPDGVTRLNAPTNAVWLLGRTLVDGREDLPAVHALQDHYRLTPLSAWSVKNRGTPAAATPASTAASTATSAPPPYDVSNPLNFFEYLNAALHENPPPAHEQALMGVFAQIGLGPDKRFAVNALDAATARGLTRAIETGQRLITALPSGRPVVNGWLGLAANTGRFGDDYRYRAYVAKYGLAANDPQEAANFSTGRDAQGEPLNGARRYVLRFEPGQLPPVKAFWSMTMYQVPSRFLVANPIARYSIGDRTPGLQRGADGSLEIYVQADSPGTAKESNWLPAPPGDFEIALRCYLPDPSIPERRWMPPAVKPAP